MSLSTATMESLAAWVAGKLGDVRGDFLSTYAIYHATSIEKWDTYEDYLFCKNVAGRVFDHTAKSTKLVVLTARHHAMNLAWHDTPQAIHDIALACGWEAPDA